MPTPTATLTDGTRVKLDVGALTEPLDVAAYLHEARFVEGKVAASRKGSHLSVMAPVVVNTAHIVRVDIAE